MAKFKSKQIGRMGLHYGRYSVRVKATSNINLIDKMNKKLQIARKKFNRKNKSHTFNLLSCPVHPYIIDVDYDREQCCNICGCTLDEVGHVTFHKKSMYFYFTDLRVGYDLVLFRIESFLTNFTTLKRKPSRGKEHKFSFPEVEVGECVTIEVYKFIVLDNNRVRDLAKRIYPKIAIPDNASIGKQLTNQVEICKAIDDENSNIKYVVGKISTDLNEFSSLNGARIKIYHPRCSPNPRGILDCLADVPPNIVLQLLKEQRLVKVEITLFKKHLKKFKRRRGAYTIIHPSLYTILAEYMRRLLGEYFDSVNKFITSIPVGFVSGGRYCYTPHTLSPNLKHSENQDLVMGNPKRRNFPYGGINMIFRAEPNSDLERELIKFLKNKNYR